MEIATEVDDMEAQWRKEADKIRRQERLKKRAKRLVAKAERIASGVRKKRSQNKQLMDQSDERSVSQRLIYREVTDHPSLVIRQPAGCPGALLGLNLSRLKLG